MSHTGDTSILIANGTVVTMNDVGEVLHADVFVRGDRVEAIGTVPDRADHVIDASGCLVLPGFVQTHVHLCQTLFRNLADDLSLLDWLRERIWPLEAAHDEVSLRASARLGIAELLLGGTTTILDMGTLHNEDVLFEEAERLGIRAVMGKAMMDAETGGNRFLRETLQQSLRETERLIREWHGAADGRLRYAVAPRFAVTASDNLLRSAVELAREKGVRLHTHASENRDEVKLIRERTGRGNVEYLHDLGFSGPDVCLAHCIWTSEAERRLLADTGTNVLHCPSANLKLGSGIASIPEYLASGVRVTLGADGAPCNNNLSVFQEMRLAALIQKPRLGPEAMPAEAVVRMATVEGARALGLGDEIGSLEPGKKADIVVMRANRVHQVPSASVYSQIVYASRASDVEAVLVDGRVLVREGRLTVDDEEEIAAEAAQQARRVAERASLRLTWP